MSKWLPNEVRVSIHTARSRLTYYFVAVCAALMLFTPAARAEDLPIPRFVTLKFNEVNARVGPQSDCPIDWVFIRAKEPVEIVAEYGHWRKISDIKGEGGWVHSRVLSGKRSVIITASKTVYLYNSANKNSRVLAHLKPNVRCELNKLQAKWCKITCQKTSGWIERKHLWGLYPGE